MTEDIKTHLVRRKYRAAVWSNKTSQALTEENIVTRPILSEMYARSEPQDGHESRLIAVADVCYAKGVKDDHVIMMVLAYVKPIQMMRVRFCRGKKRFYSEGELEAGKPLDTALWRNDLIQNPQKQMKRRLKRLPKRIGLDN